MIKKYTYQGKEYSLSGLARLVGMAPSTLSYRLLTGMAVEEAVSLPNRNEITAKQPPRCFVPQFRVVFRAPVPSVFARMQPTLGKIYVATQHISRQEANSRDFYMITLENGKSLIVYPEEFINLGLVEQTA